MRLVEEGYVNGWDDPRMPTLAGQRRRGVPAKALRDLCQHVGVARTNSTVEIELLEHFIRQEAEPHRQPRDGCIRSPA